MHSKKTENQRRMETCRRILDVLYGVRKTCGLDVEVFLETLILLDVSPSVFDDRLTHALDNWDC